jgi:hypothetical protein
MSGAGRENDSTRRNRVETLCCRGAFKRDAQCSFRAALAALLMRY